MTAQLNMVGCTHVRHAFCVSMGLKPDVVTCKTLIDSCCEEGRIEDALTVFREMLSKADKTDIIKENIVS